MRYFSVKCEYKGIKFDSLLERDFYIAYESSVVRNDRSFVIWEHKETQIKYTPDFTADNGTTWIETKGRRTDAFNLREKLIIAYCEKKGIGYRQVCFRTRAEKC